MQPVHRLSLITLAGGLLLSSPGQAASAPTLPPVRAGLWHITSLTRFEPDPEPGGQRWPGLNKPRERSYDLCLTQARAAAPMAPPRGADVRRDGADTLTASEIEPGPARGAGRVDWRFRRASDVAFDGAQTIASGAMAMTLDYEGRFVAPDCGDVQPTSPSKFGEP